MRAVGARDLRGLVVCPWGCGQAVRHTRNNNANEVFIDPVPHEAGMIAAWDLGGGWRSRQLHKGEGPVGCERRYVIHIATCRRVAERAGRQPWAPRPAADPPPPRPIPAGLAADLHAELEAKRQRLRNERGAR